MEKQTFTLALDMLNKETGKFEVGGLPGIDDHIMWDIEFEVPEKYGIYHIMYGIFVIDKNGAILAPYNFEEDGTYVGREI